MIIINFLHHYHPPQLPHIYIYTSVWIFQVGEAYRISDDTIDIWYSFYCTRHCALQINIYFKNHTCLHGTFFILLCSGVSFTEFRLELCNFLAIDPWVSYSSFFSHSFVIWEVKTIIVSFYKFIGTIKLINMCNLKWLTLNLNLKLKMVLTHMSNKCYQFSLVF